MEDQTKVDHTSPGAYTEVVVQAQQKSTNDAPEEEQGNVATNSGT